MLRVLARLLPAHVVHELGSGRALDNARRDRADAEFMLARIDELVGRIGPPSAAEVVGSTTAVAA